jgi:hypothetical protein
LGMISPILAAVCLYLMANMTAKKMELAGQR